MAERLMLHATRLEFNHPVSGERIIADCPCPF
jgi:tRNA pseudouridine32 synthase/23S rRNA pseudouridine746 synthase